jgi:uncharacterized protein YjdB
LIPDSGVRAVARTPIRVLVCFLSVALLGGCASVPGSSISNSHPQGGPPTSGDPTPQAISVSVTPATSSLLLTQTQSFTATVSNDSQNKGVSWTLSGAGCTANVCGTLSAASSASGAAITYTAPSEMPTSAAVSLTATAIADPSKSSPPAAIALVAPISLSLSPSGSTLQTSQTQTFAATVQNDSQNRGVTWTLTGAGCSGNTCGTLSATTSASGAAITYTAPSQAPSSAAVSLIATAVADPAKSSAASITVVAPVGITVSPVTSSVQEGQTQTFTAVVQNDSQNKGAVWTLTGAGCTGNACGTLSATSSASGMPVIYTAPNTLPNPATITITATSVSDTSHVVNANVTIVQPPPTVSVTVSPSSHSLAVNQSQTFAATVQKDAQNQGVNWTLSGSGCAGSTCGSLSRTSSSSGASITYTAPSAAPSPGDVTLTATSISDSRVTSSAAITIYGIPSDLSVSLTPKRGGLTLSQTLKFTASVPSDPLKEGVTWSASSGTFTNVTSTSAVYHAPAQPGVYTITATSNLDVTKSASASIGVTDLSGVTTYHNDLARDGVNSQEFALTTSNVQSSSFGKLFSCTVDAPAYTQPLWVANLSIAGGTHNVMFATSSHNTVYAFDADASPCHKYWSKNLIPSGETWLTASEAGSTDIIPDVGIVGTPVIDPLTNILYVVTKTKTIGTNGRPPGDCHQYLHALNLADGSETSSGPVEITPSLTVPGTGDGSNGTSVPFDPFHELQRPGLVLVNGTVYVSWGSVGDQKPWHGWMMGFDKSNLANIPLLYNAAPNGEGAGIWMSGGAPAVDSGNNLYVITGNGDYDGATNFGDSFVKLNLSLSLTDWFTPFDQATMNTSNADLGAGGAAVLADLPSAPVQHLMIGGGKSGSGSAGELYVLNRDALGHLEGAGTPIVQKFPVLRAVFATPAFWNNTLYIAGANGALQGYALNSTTGLFNPSPTSQSAGVFGGKGATPSISANGGSHGIVWALDTGLYGPPSKLPNGPAVLHAYDATNLNRELWNSSQAPGDQAGNAVKFTVPTIANGKVYIGTRSEIDVYGLLPN